MLRAVLRMHPQTHRKQIKLEQKRQSHATDNAGGDAAADAQHGAGGEGSNGRLSAGPAAVPGAVKRAAAVARFLGRAAEVGAALLNFAGPTFGHFFFSFASV